MPEGELSTADVDALGDRFHDIYEAQFGEGAGFPEAGVMITGFTVRATLETPKPMLPKVDAVILQDYAKGMISHRLAARIFTEAAARGNSHFAWQLRITRDER